MDDRSRKGRRGRLARPKLSKVHLTKYEALWEERFLQLQEFMQEHGHSYVPSTRTVRNRYELLGRWVETQRRSCKTRQLRQDRKRRLDAIGFDWQPMENAWVEMLARCRAFKARHGHLAIPTGCTEDPELASWAADKRARHATGSLEARYVELLERLGFCWDLQWRLWHENFARYRTIWKRTRGNPTRRLLGRKLSGWLNSMRQHRDRLNPEQLELLRSVNFAWEPQREAWEEKFSALARHQRSLKRASAAEVPAGLSPWMTEQRRAKRSGTLSPEREARLTAIGFNWKPRRDHWERQFRELLKFRKAHGHTVVPARAGALGRWVKTQRAFYKTGRLNAERIQKLEACGFSWNVAPRRNALR